MPPMSSDGAAGACMLPDVSPAPKLSYKFFCLSVPYCFSCAARCRTPPSFCDAPMSDGNFLEQSYLYPDQTVALYGSKKHLRTAFMYTHYMWCIFKLQVIHTDLHGFFQSISIYSYPALLRLRRPCLLLYTDTGIRPDKKTAAHKAAAGVTAIAAAGAHRHTKTPVPIC